MNKEIFNECNASSGELCNEKISDCGYCIHRQLIKATYNDTNKWLQEKIKEWCEWNQYDDTYGNNVIEVDELFKAWNNGVFADVNK